MADDKKYEHVRNSLDIADRVLGVWLRVSGNVPAAQIPGYESLKDAVASAVWTEKVEAFERAGAMEVLLRRALAGIHATASERSVALDVMETADDIEDLIAEIDAAKAAGG